jgi:hypothetical protein
LSVAQSTELRAPRHLKVSGAGPAHSFEPCEDLGCVVAEGGTASSCGRLACPSCGCGGTNLSTLQVARIPFGGTVSCTCGHSWIHAGMPILVLAGGSSDDWEADYGH